MLFGCPFSWAKTIFGGCKLGDQRRTRRLVDYAAEQARSAHATTLAACRGDAAAAEGAYRLLRNDKVMPDAIAKGGFEAAVERIGERALLLAVEDTTIISVPKRLEMELGDTGGVEDSRRQGMFAHSVLLVDPRCGETLGLIDQSRWVRDWATRGKHHARRERCYEEKESFKWQQASERVSTRLGDKTTRVISVCDREADVYEYMLYKQTMKERFVVRMARDRALAGERRYLSDVVSRLPPLGDVVVEVKQRGGPNARVTRTAHLLVRAGSVQLAAPKRMDHKGIPISVQVVEVIEKRPPKNTAPLHWILFTTEPVTDLAQAQDILRFYGFRWRVEDFHKAWKTGCGVEDRRQHAADNFERVIVILAFIAVRILQLRELDADNPDAPCTTVLTRLEWRCLWASTQNAPLPTQPPTAQWAVRTIGKLGGWIQTRQAPRPGWLNLWRGWDRLEERVAAINLARSVLAEEKM